MINSNQLSQLLYERKRSANRMNTKFTNLDYSLT